MVSVFVGLSPAAVVMSLMLASAPTPPASPSAIPTRDARSIEVQRIRAHFDSVLTELPAHDVSPLSRNQLSRRAQLLSTLQAYRDAGSFPHNYDFPGQPTPYFVDRKTGVLCAVAHLLESTGRRDIVDRVAAANNNVWVAELAADTAFLGWLGNNGLTLAEAARIQVPYIEPAPQIVTPKPGSTAAYSIGSAIAVGGSIATSLWTTRGNADGHRSLSNIAGFAASAASIGLGVAAASDRNAPRAVAPLSLLAGSVTAYLSTRGLMRHTAYRTAQRDAAQQRKVASASVSPILPIAGVSGAGVSVRISF
jgi:hypothetical protein